MLGIMVARRRLDEGVARTVGREQRVIVGGEVAFAAGPHCVTGAGKMIGTSSRPSNASAIRMTSGSHSRRVMCGGIIISEFKFWLFLCVCRLDLL